MKYAYKKKAYIALFSILDGIGNVIVAPIRWLRRKETITGKKILVIRCDHIGDVIASSVVLRPLRRAYPDARIDFLTSSAGAELLRGNPDIDNVIPFNAPWFERDRKSGNVMGGVLDMSRAIKKGKYDIALDLRGDARHIAAMFVSGIRTRISYGITGGGFLLTHEVPCAGVEHETKRNIDLLAPLKIFPDKVAVELRSADSDIKDAKSLVRESDIKGSYVVIHPVSGRTSKNWSPDKFACIIKFLRSQKNMTPVMIGSMSDKEAVEKMGEGIIDLCGKTSLGMLGPIISEASLFVGLDSGPAHIAAAVGTPTVILFSGTDDPDQWAPKGENVHVICPGKGKDLSEVSVEEVIEVIDKLV